MHRAETNRALSLASRKKREARDRDPAEQLVSGLGAWGTLDHRERIGPLSEVEVETRRQSRDQHVLLLLPHRRGREHRGRLEDPGATLVARGDVAADLEVARLTHLHRRHREVVELRGNDGCDRLGRLDERAHHGNGRAVHARLRSGRNLRTVHRVAGLHEPRGEARGLVGVGRGRGERLRLLTRRLVVVALPADADDDDGDREDHRPDDRQAATGDATRDLVRDGVAAGRSRGVGTVGIGHRHLLVGTRT